MNIIGPQNYPSDTAPEMLAWLGRVRCQPVPGCDLWLPLPMFLPFNQANKTFVLAQVYSIELPPGDLATTGNTLVVNPGYLTDMATIPAVLSLLAGQKAEPSNWVPAGCVHDPLYSGELVPRLVADDCLYWMMIGNGRDEATARAFKDAVNVFGCEPWDQHTPESIAASRQLAFLRTMEAT